MTTPHDDATEGMRNRYLTRTKIIHDFSDYDAALKWQLNADDLSDSQKQREANDVLFKEIIDILPKYEYGYKKRDTSLGGNDALNCFYQFNENDDIIPPYNQIANNPTKGLGRVFDDVFDSQQKLVYLSFGIPNYGNIKTFYERLIDPKLSALQNRGDWSDMVATIATIATKAVVGVVALPIIAAKWAVDWVSGSVGMTSHSKYYDFRQMMPLYFKMVNTILAHISVNMSLAPPEALSGDQIPMDGSPTAFKQTSFDSLSILNRKYRLDNLDEKADGITTDSWLAELVALGDNAFDKFTTGITQGLGESLLYAGFRLERGTDATETFSNETKSSAIEGKINSGLKSQRDKMFNIAGIKEMGGVGAVLSGISTAAQAIAEGTMSSFGITGTTELVKGSGIIDMPDVWEDSSFSTSHSFSMKLRCPCPDPVSVFYTLYTPLAFLLPAVMPRSVGPNAYTAPFLVRLYSKGLYAIPMGLIDNLTVTRGGTEFGWSVDGFPTQIDISFTVKDLSKVMHMPIAQLGNSKWDDILGQNSSFQEYLATLGGLGVKERTLASELLKRRAHALLRYSASTKLNPLHWGFSMSNSRLGRVVANVYPWSGLPKN